MSETSLNDIYESIGRLGEAVKGLATTIESNEKRNFDAISEANKSRKEMYARIDALVDRTTHLEAGNAAIKEKIESMEKVTAKVTVMSTKAEGAGTLGRWLLWIGGGVLTVAGWLIAAYTSITGRPPP